MEQPSKSLLLCVYASGTLGVLENDAVDATTKKLIARMQEIDQQRAALRRERDAITTALAVAGWRPTDAHKAIYTMEESEYQSEQPFKGMSLTDACLKVLRDHADKDKVHEQWMDKSQVEYMVTRGGYEFNTDDATNSVNVSLRRLAAEGYCEAHAGKGSRPTVYHFKKERVPGEQLARAFNNDVKSKDSRPTSKTETGER